MVWSVQHIYLVACAMCTFLGHIQASICVLYNNYLCHYELIALYKIIFDPYALLIKLAIY